jgi:hypothetical protein
MKGLLIQLSRCMPLLVLFACTSDLSAFYNPQLQRWINRDPIGENGGANLYAFVANRPILSVDFEGLQFNPNAPQVPLPPAFPSKPFEAPPRGTGGTSGGSLPPAYPTINYRKCSQEGATRTIRPPYDSGSSCPCTNVPIRCFDYEQCEWVGTARTTGTYERLGWRRYTRCTICPEGNYAGSGRNE